MDALHGFTRGLDYPSIVAASERVAWSVNQIFDGRRFDASKPIVPAGWVGTGHLDFLDARDQRTLNHCRAFSYVHLIGNLEEFVTPHLADTVRFGCHDDRGQLRALLRFGEEELKHQQLFARAEQVLEGSCGYAFTRYFDPDKLVIRRLTNAILTHAPLSIFLMALAFELGTQRHYVESIRDRRGVDPLYVDVLRAHWVEEAQHTKCDLLEVSRLSRGMSDVALARACDDVRSLGALVDAVFRGQADGEIDTLRRVTGRALAEPERVALHAALHASLGAIMAGVGLGHPTFVQVVRELSSSGATALGVA